MNIQKPIELELHFNEDGILRAGTFPDGYDGPRELKFKTIRMREVSPGELTAEQVIDKICHLLRTHKASSLASKAWADHIEANKEGLLK